MNLYALIIILTSLLSLAGCSKTPQLPSLSQDAVILAFGDSLTYGTGANESESYPAVLSQLTGRKVVNAGVPGEISAVGAERLSKLLELEHPALIILCHGGNDLLAHQNHQLIKENLKRMILMAGEKRISILLIAVPSPDLTLKPPDIYKELSKEFNIPIEQRALSNILGKSSLKSDYIHPNAVGYKKLAEGLAELLKKSGALP